MGILLPEKIIVGLLAEGLAAIKADLDAFIPDIFEVELYGAEYQQMIADFLAAKPMRIYQAYPTEETHIPGWFVVPSSADPREHFIGEYASADDLAVTTQVEGEDPETNYFEVESNGVLMAHSVRILTASANVDSTLFLEAIARYIILSNAQALQHDYGFGELQVMARDLDPIYQYLPERLAYKTTMLSLVALDTWTKRFPAITDINVVMRVLGASGFYEI